MFLLAFLIVTTGLIFSLGVLVQFKLYRMRQRLALLGLSALFIAHLWIAYASEFAGSPRLWFGLERILQGLGLLIGLGILELTRHFLRDGAEADEIWKWGHRHISLFSLAVLGTAVGEAVVWMPGQLIPALSQGVPTVIFGGFSLLVPILRMLISVYVLYLLENTYRFAHIYQRRIARLGFIGLGSLSAFHIIFFARVLLYRLLPEHFAAASSVVYGMAFPVVLAGFLRYRLGSERIMVPRETVYTSATVFLTGSAFLGVALTIFAFQWLDLDFNYFELFLFAFSLCFLAVLLLGAGSMRRRIARWVNRQIYSRKYDYQEQFFRLHKTMMSGADIDSALTELVENMKYSVTVEDAFVFILNWQDGHFYQHENKEEATARGLSIRGDGPLARLLDREAEPVDFLATDGANTDRLELAKQEPLVERLRLDAIFPVFIGERLAGILATQGGRSRPFDPEDLDLISVFTNSIGDALFKNRVLQERIERKQFDAFHHVASFIIHDIKNQIATLNLLLKNAEKNLGNPDFQASMLASVKSSAGNLQGLIDRLAVAPQAQEVKMARAPLRPLLLEVVQNSGLASLPQLDFALEGQGSAGIPMDRQALFFVIRNLINNSLEALRRSGEPGPRGRLRLSFGYLDPEAPQRLADLFGGGERFAGYAAWILVEDEGAGMDPDFVRRRLFQPFATTKEKGVGIGLYQCKTLVEQMGGKILVHSVLGKGTEFCILLGGGKNPN